MGKGRINVYFVKEIYSLIYEEEKVSETSGGIECIYLGLQFKLQAMETIQF